jgi:putative membrane protein
MAQEIVTEATAGPEQVNLAVERTFLAHERTLMAWVRTATSMITFGFTLYKFFNYLRDQKGGQPDQELFGPRTYGLIMMGVGVFMLVLATLQHRRRMLQLRARFSETPLSLSAVLAALIAGLGIFGFIAALFRQ